MPFNQCTPLACEQLGASPRSILKDEIMLSKATKALIVSEIVAGYAKIIRVNGKLMVVGAR